MREMINSQMRLGEVDISKIQFDLRCRDEIPKILMGLQHIYCTSDLREKVFAILEKTIPAHIDKHTGRPGMQLWKIFVLGTLRLNCYWDFDKLHDISNNHRTLRQMLGHHVFGDTYRYALQTLKDNLSLLTPEILEEINHVVVEAGYQLLKVEDQALYGRCDSFVVETDVHYPTDINLLWDAIRKAVELVYRVCVEKDIPSWRQAKHHLKRIKGIYRKAQQSFRGKPKTEKAKLKRQKQIIQSHHRYIDKVNSFLERIQSTIETHKTIPSAKGIEIASYIAHAHRQIDQIRRRVIEGENIAHSEKVFSIFQPHTEWIVKGKAGTPQQLGLRVCVIEDQHGFLLHHHLMQKQDDKQIAVPITKTAKEKFPNITRCSYDGGFYSPSNLQELSNIVEEVILPKKGGNPSPSPSQDWQQARVEHSQVESAISALVNHGLARCPDHGIEGFERYVALAVVARNIQILGHIIQQKMVKQKLKKHKPRKYQEPLAA